MRCIIRDYIEHAESASNPNDLRGAVAEVIAQFDFNAFAFFAPSDIGKPPLLVSNYDERWQTHYVARGYQRRDPVKLHSRCVIDLFAWSPEMAARSGPLAKDFFYEAEAFDIRSGVTVPIPDWPGGFAAMTFFFVLGLRHLGSARTGAYFSTAPFIGAVLAIAIFQEPITFRLIAAAVLMAIGVGLHLIERHEHYHVHDALDHEHRHVHDEHHQHAHAPGDPAGEPHTHRHKHVPLAHAHAHYLDLHHRHNHELGGANSH